MIKSEVSLQISILKKLKKNQKCWEWQGAVNDLGYPIVTLNFKNYFVHKIAYKLFVENVPSGMMVKRKCDNRLCINPDHLFLYPKHARAA